MEYRAGTFNNYLKPSLDRMKGLLRKQVALTAFDIGAMATAASFAGENLRNGDVSWTADIAGAVVLGLIGIQLLRDVARSRRMIKDVESRHNDMMRLDERENLR